MSIQCKVIVPKDLVQTCCKGEENLRPWEHLRRQHSLNLKEDEDIKPGVPGEQEQANGEAYELTERLKSTGVDTALGPACS